ncbi:hypothetical protein TKK_0007455 [Trichogramma kaykai]
MDNSLNHSQDSNETVIADEFGDEYLSQLNSENIDDLDLTSGVRKEKSNLMIGSSKVEFDSDHLTLDGEKKFKLSRGLTELLFKKNPDDKLIQENDLSVYHKILDITSAHKKKYDSNEQVRAWNQKKYTKYIHPHYDSSKRGGGGGRMTFGWGKKKSFLNRSILDYKIANLDKQQSYRYWDDPNELVERLHLLTAEYRAGNSAHINEINSIIEELREAAYIY